MTQTSPGRESSMSSMSTKAVVGHACSSPSSRASSTLLGHRAPEQWRPCGRWAMAASMSCWTRWMWLAKQATIIRRPAARERSAQSVSPTELSESVNARLLGVGRVGEQQADALGPSARAPMRARSVRRPSTGREVELEVARVQDDALGVCGRPVAKPLGTEWVTGMNSTSKGPIRRRSPSATSMKSVRVAEPGLLEAVAGEAEGQRRAVDGDVDVPQQVAPAPPMWSSWPWVSTMAVDACRRCSRSQREVRQDEVDAGHVGLGEHQPAVDDDDAPVLLDGQRSCGRSRRDRRGR